MKYRNQLGEYLNFLGLCGEGAEIGVHTGRFSRAILNHWHGRALWLVDPWRHMPDYLDSWNASDAVMKHRLRIARRRLKQFSMQTFWIRERSEHAVAWFEDSSLDFVYLDANHSYKHVSRDLVSWYPKIRPGGLFAGHDYFNALADCNLEPLLFGEHHPSLLTSYGVKAAVDQFVLSKEISLQTTYEKYPSWYFLKV